MEPLIPSSLPLVLSEICPQGVHVLPLLLWLCSFVQQSCLGTEPSPAQVWFQVHELILHSLSKLTNKTPLSPSQALNQLRNKTGCRKKGIIHQHRADMNTRKLSTSPPLNYTKHSNPVPAFPAKAADTWQSKRRMLHAQGFLQIDH